jgi:hypothetical protein
MRTRSAPPNTEERSRAGRAENGRHSVMPPYILFASYLIIQRRKIASEMKDELETDCKEVVVTYSRHYYGIYLEGIRTRESSQR